MDRNMQIIKDRTDDLNRRAWEIRVSDSNKALLLSEEAIGLAKTIDYTKGMAKGFAPWGLAICAFQNMLRHMYTSTRHYNYLSFCMTNVANQMFTNI